MINLSYVGAWFDAKGSVQIGARSKGPISAYIAIGGDLDVLRKIQTCLKDNGIYSGMAGDTLRITGPSLDRFAEALLPHVKVKIRDLLILQEFRSTVRRGRGTNTPEIELARRACMYVLKGA